jgi:nucleotide-binding universal stress UspA family protein
MSCDDRCGGTEVAPATNRDCARTFTEGKQMKEKEKRRILCPIAFDANSLAALDLAGDLVRENNGTLYVLHVVPPGSSLVVAASLLFERARHFARIELEEIARESLSGIDHQLLVRSGCPADGIIAAARAVQAHIIVIATHGRAGAPRCFLGSVAEKVIRGAPCPVLTVRGASACESSHSRAAAKPGSASKSGAEAC